jgi:hypothetical protein
VGIHLAGLAVPEAGVTLGESMHNPCHNIEISPNMPDLRKRGAPNKYSKFALSLSQKRSVACSS